MTFLLILFLMECCDVHKRQFLSLLFDDIFGLNFDSPPLRFLCRMAPASSARGDAYTLRDGGPGAFAGSSVPFIASIILALMVAALGGDCLVLVRRFQS